MKYFSIEQVVKDLQSGAVRRHVIKTNERAALSRGYTERAEMFAEAIRIYDEWRTEQ
ncbi:hypothetical protein [Erwinia typographi]|uniref:hypothetical protein n=1 Tax=Erwinia typographi TaxID=371042 RepID=UPI000A47F317|nr:hypothetical protein [Erwinia typographi]